MARIRSSSSSSKFRYCNPSYYLKRPKRLALLLILFVSASSFVWDRQTLVREHEFEVSKLNDEVRRLQNMLEEFTNRVPANVPIEMQRREKVKEAMIHAWSAYEKYAWGNDELLPQTQSGENSFGGLGATIVDSLDTLLIMGLDEQFQKARESSISFRVRIANSLYSAVSFEDRVWVANTLDFNKTYDASVFETTIRVVGGLLSTYDLSGDNIFLEKARDIADRLLPAWDTPSGIPYNIINLARGNAHNPGWTGGKSILADSGTEQLEFIALSQRTGDPKYQEKVEKAVVALNKTFPADGLVPIYVDPNGGTAYGTITFGAMGDRSSHLKLPRSFFFFFWLHISSNFLFNKIPLWNVECRDMWETSMKGLVSLIRRSSPSSFAYICEKTGETLTDKDHLVMVKLRQKKSFPWLKSSPACFSNMRTCEIVIHLLFSCHWACLDLLQFLSVHTDKISWRELSLQSRKCKLSSFT
ncbi:hypothetical protein CXB51_026887 [Gossypium anomalum]|uniref:alpha-1,2-Mannosidase n=1 Tax=Gossypium anomalum TaxID=47600 RepID=A0A8J6CSS0_9ROSI|nr:hypothetical protein CXB51_026887 [Gossypium anomalum]